MRIIGYKLTPFQRLHILLTKDDDAAFFFFLDISESDFRTLRQRQGLLVDMSSFPSMLEGLLSSCRLLSHVFLINNLMKANCYHLGSRKSALCSLKNSLNIQIDIRSPSLFKLSVLEQNYLGFFSEIMFNKCQHKHSINFILSNCRAEESSSSPKFLPVLVKNSGPSLDSANLEITETNLYRRLVHLSLEMCRGTDARIREHLAERLVRIQSDFNFLSDKFRHSEDQIGNYRNESCALKEEVERLRREKAAQVSGEYTRPIPAPGSAAIILRQKWTKIRIGRQLELGELMST